MDVWEVPQSSCPGLDKGFLMEVRPQRTTSIVLSAVVNVTDASNLLGKITHGRAEQVETR